MQYALISPFLPRIPSPQNIVVQNKKCNIYALMYDWRIGRSASCCLPSCLFNYRDYSIYSSKVYIEVGELIFTLTLREHPEFCNV